MFNSWINAKIFGLGVETEPIVGLIIFVMREFCEILLYRGSKDFSLF